jgi:hypothetical protein
MTVHLFPERRTEVLAVSWLKPVASRRAQGFASARYEHWDMASRIML